MPIKIPDNLPATKILEQENIFVIKESRAYEQDIRPLKILLLKLLECKANAKSVLTTKRISAIINTQLGSAISITTCFWRKSWIGIKCIYIINRGINF